MANTKVNNSQLTNWATYLMYQCQMFALAQNVFVIENLPDYMDKDYIKRNLVYRGSIAFFYDDILEELCALPYSFAGTYDMYGRPTKIIVQGQNGYHRTLRNNQFVIMYDNTSRDSIYLNICQYAQRLAQTVRTTDVNIAQQKTPRIWTTTSEKYMSLKNLMNNIDSFEETILKYDGIDFGDVNCICEPAPFVADKLDEHGEKIWNEFLRFIGVSNLAVTKKERNIKDEIMAMQGGTIASRFNRFEPRKDAIEKINKMFGAYLNKPLEVRYYDGEPDTEEPENVESGVDEDVDLSVSTSEI